MKPETAILIGTLAGTAIGAITTILVTLITKNMEKNIRFQELLANVAVEEWKERVALVDRRGGSIWPTYYYISFHKIMLDVIFDKNTTQDNIIIKLKEAEEYCNEILKFIQNEE